MAENATLFIVGVIAIIGGAAMIYFFGVDGWRALTAANMDGALPFFNIETLVSGSHSYTNSTG